VPVRVAFPHPRGMDLLTELDFETPGDDALPAASSAAIYDVAVVGGGYVGVPLAATFAEAGRRVLVVDVQPQLVEALNAGVSHIEDVPSERLGPLVEKGLVVATSDYEQVRQAAAVLIALPTPLSRQREPDLSYVERAARSLAPVLQPGQVVVLESTTWPGTTREIVQPILEHGSGLRAGVDFHLAMSPERVDPGRADWTTKTTPKVVGGINAASTQAAAAVYRGAVDTVHEVSTPEAAELTKLLENIFRAVNIALVNELAQLCDRMDIDVWEVIDAAASKPFGFMSFKPGPGLGGHCIPIDPFYLTWKAREFDFSTRFIELAGEVNNNMPYFCRSLISQALNHGAQKSVKGSRILVVGVAYKPDIGDSRETPAEKLIRLLKTAGATVHYHDPYVPEFDGMTSSDLTPEDYDCVAIVTNHSQIDYTDLVHRADVVVDFRNATRGIDAPGKIWKL
jgi:UDP-N-acetyl-D-glucosamine dehydrogenase